MYIAGTEELDKAAKEATTQHNRRHSSTQTIEIRKDKNHQNSKQK
jgi:hypothetical protein